MHIASALRRKRDEIAATIAACEATIDAARMDLAALERAARLFDPEAGRSEAVIPWDLDRLTNPEERLEARREADERRPALTRGRLALPVARTQEHPSVRSQGTIVRTAACPQAPERIPGRIFLFGLAITH